MHSPGLLPGGKPLESNTSKPLPKKGPGKCSKKNKGAEPNDQSKMPSKKLKSESTKPSGDRDGMNTPDPDLSDLDYDCD